MSRIAATFDTLRAQRRTALIPYITVGDPFADATPEIMHGLVRAGPTSSNSACRFPTRWPTAR